VTHGLGEDLAFARAPDPRGRRPQRAVQPVGRARRGAPPAGRRGRAARVPGRSARLPHARALAPRVSRGHRVLRPAVAGSGDGGGSTVGESGDLGRKPAVNPCGFPYPTAKIGYGLEGGEPPLSVIPGLAPGVSSPRGLRPGDRGTVLPCPESPGSR